MWHLCHVKQLKYAHTSHFRKITAVVPNTLRVTSSLKRINKAKNPLAYAINGKFSSTRFQVSLLWLVKDTLAWQEQSQVPLSFILIAVWSWWRISLPKRRSAHPAGGSFWSRGSAGQPEGSMGRKGTATEDCFTGSWEGVLCWRGGYCLFVIYLLFSSYPFKMTARSVLLWLYIMLISIISLSLSAILFLTATCGSSHFW